jgi:hypothetical protein
MTTPKQPSVINATHVPAYGVPYSIVASRLRSSVMILLLCAACGGNDSTGPTSYDGSWSGTTSQNETITFSVSGNAITMMHLGFDLTGNCSSAPVGVTMNFVQPRPIVGNSFEITGSTEVSGTFSSATAASGSFDVNFTGTGGCSSRATGTWSARR